VYLGGGGEEANAPPIFFISKISYFFGYWVEEPQIKEICIKVIYIYIKP